MNDTRRINKVFFGATLILLLVPTFAGQALAQTCALSPADLVSWWPGDGNANDIADGNTGTLVNGATFATGFVTSGNGQAFSFDGMDDHIFVNNSLNLDFGTANFTVDYWMNSPLTSVNQGHLKKTNGAFNASGEGWEIRTQGTLLEFARADGTPSPAFLPVAERLHHSGLTPNEWIHIAVTYDFPSRTGKLYVDGSLVDSGQFIVFKDFTVVPPVSTGVPSDAYTDIYDLEIGHGNDGFFDGLIDEVQIYNRALSAQEIQNIFNAGIAGKCKDAISSLSALSQTIINFDLSNGINMGLDAKLANVLQALQDVNENNDVAALNSLNAFINAVEAQRGQSITEAEADSLVSIAQQVIAQLSL